jgi:heme A synthase
MGILFSPGILTFISGIVVIFIIVSLILEAFSAGKTWRIIPLLLCPLTGIIAGLLWNADPVEVGHEMAEKYRLLAIIAGIFLIFQVIVGAFLTSDATKKTR